MSTDTENRLIMTWTEVPDNRGGTRLQARWIDPSQVTSPVTSPAAETVLATPRVGAHAA